MLYYNVLPGSIISRFIVRMHSYIHKETYWRTGVVLAYEENRALVKADKEDKKIFISINGPDRTRRIFLAVIRSNFDAIHKTIAKIEAKEKVPLPGNPDIIVDYKHLLKLEELGESSFIPEGMEERVDVKKLLHGIESQKTKVFISYVPEDTQNAEKMYEALNQYGAEPFFAKESLVPGQRREVTIKQAIKDSRFFIALLSSNSVKKGNVIRELASALKQLDDFPESDIFIIPVRLDECTPSHEKLKELHFVDMFPNWEQGFEKIIQAIGKC